MPRPARIALILLLFFVLISGCSTVQVDTIEAIDWDSIATVTVLDRTSDSWPLAQAVREELADMGFKIVDQGAGADLWAYIVAEDGPDLNAEGQIQRRLKNFEIEFRTPRSKAPQATLTYYFPPGSSEMTPAEGVHEAFLEMHQRLRQGTGPEMAENSEQAHPGIETPPANAETPQASPPQSSTTMPKPKAESFSTEQGQDFENQERTMSSTRSESTSAREQESTEKKPKKSPWIPRFKSWGLEDWGQNEPGSY